MIIGIDNGLGGGIVVLSPAGEILHASVMPVGTGPRGRGMDENIVDARLFSALIGQFPEADHIAIERPAGSQDVNAVQSMADSFATCRTIILCRNRTLHTVNARTWQTSFWIPPAPVKRGAPKPPKFDTKRAATLVCRRIWPGHMFLAGPRSQKPHDGIQDAALIAEHLRRSLHAPELLQSPILNFRDADPTLQPVSDSKKELF